MSEFCPTCEEYREVRNVERKERYTIRGTEVVVPVALAVCATCGEGLGSDDQDQRVLDAAHAEYRCLNEMLGPEQIRSIRTRYRLSQKSFAALLGMSEATVNRYEKGALQDQLHDNAIRACEDPAYLRDLVQRRGHLLSEWQRKRTEAALAGESQPESTWIDLGGLPDWPAVGCEVSERTGFRRFDYERFAATVVWFCRRLKSVPTTVINKLLFYADFLNYKTATVSLTGTAYRRLQYGPVPSDYGDLLYRMEAEGLLERSEVAFPDGCVGSYYNPGPEAEAIRPAFSEHEKKVLMHVAKVLGHCTAKIVSDRSHQESAWRNTEEKGLISYQEAATLSLDLPDEP